MSRTRLSIAGAIVAAVALSTTVALAKPLSEAQWRKKANSVCKQINKDLNQAGNEAFAGVGENEEPSTEQLTAFAEQAGPTIEEGLLSIDALDEPKSVKKDLKKFNAAVSEVLAALQDDPTVLLTDEDPFAKADKLARRLGLKACAGG